MKVLTLSDTMFGIQLGVVAPLQARYSGAPGDTPENQLRRKKYIELSNLGATGYRGMTLPGFFEWEEDPQGRAEYDALLPVQDVSNPSINPHWEAETIRLLEDLKAARLFPTISLFGGCDFHQPYNPADNNHWPAIELYISRTVEITRNLFGDNFAVEPGNEMYVAWWGQWGADMQVRISDYLLSLGILPSRIRYSALDGVSLQHINKINALDAQKQYSGNIRQAIDKKDWQTVMQIFQDYPQDSEEFRDCVYISPFIEFLQVAAFDPDKSSPQAVANRKYRVGFTVHEIGEPRHFDRWGHAGRISVNNYAPALKGELQNVQISDDGYGFDVGSSKFKGMPFENIRPVYHRFYDTCNHPAVGHAVFEHLSNQSIKWQDGFASVVFGAEIAEYITEFVEAYREKVGSYPINKTDPVQWVDPSPPAPPVPDDDPVDPVEPPSDDDEKEEIMNVRLFGPWSKKNVFGLSIPWPSIRVEQWLNQWPRAALNGLHLTCDSLLFLAMSLLVGGVIYGLACLFF